MPDAVPQDTAPVSGAGGVQPQQYDVSYCALGHIAAFHECNGVVAELRFGCTGQGGRLI